MLLGAGHKKVLTPMPKGDTMPVSLKPSNILVTLHDGEPVPKVIDFGVAKALGQKLTERRS